jgi:hypothetical protein
MGRLVRAKEEGNLAEAVLIKPAPVSDPGVYVARNLSDGPQYQRISELTVGNAVVHDGPDDHKGKGADTGSKTS